MDPRSERDSPPASLLNESSLSQTTSEHSVPVVGAEANHDASLNTTSRLAADATTDLWEVDNLYAESGYIWLCDIDKNGVRGNLRPLKPVPEVMDSLRNYLQNTNLDAGDAASSGDANELTIDPTIKPRVLLMGMKRSGKSSISAVLFGEKSPSETLHLEPSRAIDVRNFTHYQLWDCPASLVKSIIRESGPEAAEVFDAPGSLVYIIDAQDQETHRATCADLCELIAFVQKTRPHINLEVFFHKFDSMSEDFGGEIVDDTRLYILDELQDMGIENPSISFHNTSIYDVSMYEALSKCGQKLIERRHWALENILNSLCSKTGIEKAYLLEPKTKICIASDTSPANSKHYEACIELLDLTVDICGIYAWREEGEAGFEEGEMAEGEKPPEHTSCEMWSERGNFMGLWEITKDLVLVCVFVTGDPGENLPTVNHNITQVREGLIEVLNYELEQ